MNQLVRHSGDPHALTSNGVRHHWSGGVAHGDDRQRLGHGHCHWCHRYSHWCHRDRGRHPLCNGLCEGSWQGGDLRIQMGRRGGRWGSISWGGWRGTSGSYQVLLSDRSRLQSSAAQGGVSLGNAVVVGTYCTNRGRQTLLTGGRSGRQRHHLGLASELCVLFQ